MHSARLAEVAGRRPRTIPLVERLGGALGELERLSVNRHEEIACAARNHLARPTVTQASETLRRFALVADFAAVASAGECKFGLAHGCKVDAHLLCLRPKLSDGGHETVRWQPRRPAAVRRCSAWLAVTMSPPDKLLRERENTVRAEPNVRHSLATTSQRLVNAWQESRQLGVRPQRSLSPALSDRKSARAINQTMSSGAIALRLSQSFADQRQRQVE